MTCTVSSGTLNPSIPYYTIPYHTIPHHTTPHHTIPHHTIPYPVNHRLHRPLVFIQSCLACAVASIFSQLYLKSTVHVSVSRSLFHVFLFALYAWRYFFIFHLSVSLSLLVYRRCRRRILAGETRFPSPTLTCIRDGKERKFFGSYSVQALRRRNWKHVSVVVICYGLTVIVSTG